jgi:hypothetical protein
MVLVSALNRTIRRNHLFVREQTDRFAVMNYVITHGGESSKSGHWSKNLSNLHASKMY